MNFYSIELINLMEGKMTWLRQKTCRRDFCVVVSNDGTTVLVGCYQGKEGRMAGGGVKLSGCF